MAAQREAVQFFVAGGLSVQRACALVQIHRSTYRWRSRQPGSKPRRRRRIPNKALGAGRGVADPAAIQAIFPRTHIQRCLIHQVRHSMAYVTWKGRKAFAMDLQAIYGAPTREAAEAKLARLSEKWGRT